ncbi:L-fucose mutarotase [Arcanobacterium wilhelmae]|uniref:L-fucose mutarotase n=1 Tax=Arcanobacterium wilhelmae TaxID=1803177 RepID=A0ABT9NBB0_9ACTO|nr:RbsD/FucU domain-containing protein [Arcanobacterium wilhelmae]MDP9801004.1 L-fucose mutarotase [Arcanobacterium wilhelmae]WFN90364.1 RbsD/FucU domain-containing protein [Arcanobacterium wilhelmae]
MLKKISPVLSPELLKAIAEMGHGDELTLADAHYPQSGSADVVIRADGVGIPELLAGILELIPLDQYNDWQYGLMATVGDDPEPDIWETYADIVRREESEATPKFFERFEFYEVARRSHVTVLTGETSQYGNIILKKGVVLPQK